MIYALIVNLALALINRLTPQIQIVFIAAPFVVAGALGAALRHHQAGARSLPDRLRRLALLGIETE